MLPLFKKTPYKTKTKPQKLGKLERHKYFPKSLSFHCTLLVLVSMHEVLNAIYNLWDAQIKVIKSVWALPSGACRCGAVSCCGSLLFSGCCRQKRVMHSKQLFYETDWPALASCKAQYGQTSCAL